MSTCVVCSVQTTKYRCPQCFLRYCSLVCCRTHKETCVKPSSDTKPDGTTQVQQLTTNDSVSRERELLIQSQVIDDEDEDKVPAKLLQQLEHSPGLKEILSNPHLRGILEDLVKSDKPEAAMARAMREPIFTEFADACLQIVDTNNPNVEQSTAGAST
ncbi:hypothetical protein BsWGS_08112 [Bradybaena similaris]